MSEPVQQPGALVLDLEPVRDLGEAIQALEQAWARCPPAVRDRLGRLLWLHPGGEVVVYRAPEG